MVTTTAELRPLPVFVFARYCDFEFFPACTHAGWSVFNPGKLARRRLQKSCMQNS